MKPSDITDPCPHLVTRIADILYHCENSTLLEGTDFESHFREVLDSIILLRPFSPQNAEDTIFRFHVTQQLVATCTVKLKQAVKDEIKLLKFDNIT